MMSIPLFQASRKFFVLALALGALASAACARTESRRMEVTAYCPCGECCGWERGTFDPWNRYVTGGSRKGKPYTGRTASGTKPNTYHPGLFSLDSLTEPWMIPPRIVLFPWLLLPQKGTLAADTDYYPFGTEIFVPGYGWGIVEDRGGAIKGPDRLDAYFPFHGTTNNWGRQRLTVKIVRKE